jgi:hypothetical protein
MIFNPGIVAAAFLIAGCSSAINDKDGLRVASAGHSCAAAANGSAFAISCADPDKKKVVAIIELATGKKP